MVAHGMSQTPDPLEGRPGAEAPGRIGRAGSAIRGLALDLSPLRESRDYRFLWFGELISSTGSQITVVALPFQIYLLTRSPLAVGMIGLVQVVPLVVFSILGGALADRFDRRKLILVTEVGLAGTSVLLLLGALSPHPPLWYLYTVTGGFAGLFGVNTPTRSASIPNLVSRRRLPAALALNQVLFNSSVLVGPALAGLILAIGGLRHPDVGLRWAYGIDALSYTAAFGSTLLIRPLPPKREEGTDAPTGWHAVREGFSFLRGKRVLLSTFLIDLDAMIFGMPRALFPVLAFTVFHVGPEKLGLLYAAPAAGALAGALTTGWVGRIRHQGRAVICAVVIWGAAVAAFGVSGRFFWLALLFLAIAGAADVISAVFRGTILQLSVPDSLRGRLSAVHIMVVSGGPRLGDVEAGAVAALVSPVFSVVSGGLACIVGAFALAALIPQFWRYHAEDVPSYEGGGS
jgi:MFS family permease